MFHATGASDTEISDFYMIEFSLKLFSIMKIIDKFNSCFIEQIDIVMHYIVETWSCNPCQYIFLGYNSSSAFVVVEESRLL